MLLLLLLLNFFSFIKLEYFIHISLFVHSSDCQSELEAVKRIAVDSGAFNAVICNHWASGGAGAADLATAVIEATSQPSQFKFLYPLEVSQALHNHLPLICIILSVVWEQKVNISRNLAFFCDIASLLRWYVVLS